MTHDHPNSPGGHVMVTAHPDTEKALRNLTVDYSSGHVLIDGRPIGNFVAEQGPEVLASPAPDLYIVNIPLMVKSVTFLPSGETFTGLQTVSDAFQRLATAFGTGHRYSESEVRLALAHAVPERQTIERVIAALGEAAP